MSPWWNLAKRSGLTKLPPLALFIGCALVLGMGSGKAHDIITTRITWSHEVSRIIYRRCATCHHPGGSAFSLMTWEEARPWAVAIKDEVLARRMPPWNAVKGFGEFKDERALSQDDLDVLANWVVGGAPEGNPLYSPPKPVLTNPEASHGNERRLAIDGGVPLKEPIEASGVAVDPLP